jgi:DNA polymerase-3 subunit alpha
MRGSVELLVFPQALQQLQGVLKPDAALLIKGRVRHEENSRPKVVVSEAKPLEAAANGAKPELLIRINLEQSGENVIDDIERLLAGSPGDHPVVFELIRPGDFQTRLRPRKVPTVRADDRLLAQLRALCSEEPALLEKKANRNSA